MIFNADVRIKEVTREGVSNRGTPYLSIRGEFTTRRGTQTRIMTAFGRARNAVPAIGETARLAIMPRGGNLYITGARTPAGNDA